MKCFLPVIIIVVVLISSCIFYNLYINAFTDEMLKYVQSAFEKVDTDYSGAKELLDSLDNKFKNNRNLLSALMNHDMFEDAEKYIEEIQLLYELGDVNSLKLCLVRLDWEITDMKNSLSASLDNIL